MFSGNSELCNEEPNELECSDFDVPRGDDQVSGLHTQAGSRSNRVVFRFPFFKISLYTLKKVKTQWQIPPSKQTPN